MRGEGQHFAYDHNGNMTLRLEAGAAYQQQFDVQNRLLAVNDLFSDDSTTFAYDAAGQRVKTNRPDGTLTHYPFPTYEKEVRSGTEVIQPGEGGQDATVYSFSPAANYDDDPMLIVGSHLSSSSAPNGNGRDMAAVYFWRSLLRFDLSGIPTGATVTNTTLTLYCRVVTGPSSQQVWIRPVTATWAEGTVTWSNQPAVGSAPQTSLTVTGSNYSPYQIDMTAFVQAWQGGTLTNHGFRLHSSGSDDRQVDCRSSEHTTAEHRPKLTVDWEFNPVTRSTYSLAGQVVAVRVAGHTDSSKNGLFYLHSDHLGSNSVMSKADGTLVADSVSRYYPYGDWRTEPTAALTDIGYTGHKHNNLGSDDIGLIYMNARYYVVGVGRFASADTIVPDPLHPQQFNRYAYSLNNPIRYTDPTGHKTCAEMPWECDGEGNWLGQPKKQYDLTTWLAAETVINVNGPEITQMQVIGAIEPIMPSIDPLTGLPSVSLGTPDFSPILFDFYQLNKTKGKWDIKQKISQELGEGIILCGSDGCGWFDYSTPGNIMFGYNAAAVGIPPGLSTFAGGALEVLEGTAALSNWSTSFEDPYDQAAVAFGYNLYNTYGPDMTLSEFQSALTADVQATLQPPPSGFSAPFAAVPQSNYYKPGHFNCTPANPCE